VILKTFMPNLTARFARLLRKGRYEQLCELKKHLQTQRKKTLRTLRLKSMFKVRQT